jgi:hypothetical protein
MKQIGTKLYDDKIDEKILKYILDILTFIEPKFISREEYSKLN